MQKYGALTLARPVVRYAHARAAAMGQEVNFAQMNAEETTFEDGYFDLAVSHILLHETSGKAMPRIFAECQPPAQSERIDDPRRFAAF